MSSYWDEISTFGYDALQNGPSQEGRMLASVNEYAFNLQSPFEVDSGRIVGTTVFILIFGSLGAAAGIGVRCLGGACSCLAVHSMLSPCLALSTPYFACVMLCDPVLFGDARWPVHFTQILHGHPREEDSLYLFMPFFLVPGQRAPFHCPRRRSSAPHSETLPRSLT